MELEYHLIASAALAAAFYAALHSLGASLALFAAGVLIDADHVFDYYLFKRRLELRPGKLNGFYARFGRIYVPLHSYELLAPLWLLAPQSIALGATVGFLTHIAMEHAAYKMHPLAYSALFRASRNFELGSVCSGSVARAG
jgi:hypothetical protein